MKRIVSVAVALVVAFFALTPVFAQSGSTYDWRSGNWYHWYSAFDGSTHVQGFNWNTGSQWRTTIRPNGDMQGWDSRGDFWRYDSRTGNYWNSNGTFCTGRGYARTCW
jgi:hypothetical protein